MSWKENLDPVPNPAVWSLHIFRIPKCFPTGPSKFGTVPSRFSLGGTYRHDCSSLVSQLALKIPYICQKIYLCLSWSLETPGNSKPSHFWNVLRIVGCLYLEVKKPTFQSTSLLHNSILEVDLHCCQPPKPPSHLWSQSVFIPLPQRTKERFTEELSILFGLQINK